MRRLFQSPLGLSPQGVPKKCNGGALADVASGLLGGVVNLIATQSQNASNEDIALRNILMQRETNHLNYKMFHEQQDYGKEMYQRQLLDNRQDAATARQQFLQDREYDSPYKKMTRLREAGLNPFLNYGDNNYGIGSVQSNPASYSNPSAPTMIAPQDNHHYVSPLTGFGQTLSDSVSNALAMYYDLHYREEQNKREWVKALADSPFDQDTKEELSNLFVFKKDKSQGLMSQLLEERVMSLVKDNTIKQAQINFQQDLNDEQRKQWNRNQELHEKNLGIMTQQLLNLEKEGKLMDDEGKLSKASVELIENEVKQMKDFNENTPEWVRQFVNFFQRALGGSVFDLLKLFKRGK